MNNFIKILKSIFVAFYLFLIVYIAINHVYISVYTNIPESTVFLFVGINILLLGLYYFTLIFKINKLELEFRSIVNHVFRTPLTRIMWITKELKKEDLNKKEKDTYLQNLENATTRLINIIDIIAGIKDIKNTQGYFFEAVSIREIFEKSIAKYGDMINKKNIKFNLFPSKDIPLLTVDLKKISFVIDVLIENAIFYTLENGYISIEAKLKSDRIILSVSDSGIGLSFMDKMRVFSRFYRNKRARLMYTDGMGLGLYLSQVIVRRHRGKIYTKSKGVNKGTTFFLELPFSR